ncbi:MAG: hypothetical protein ACRCU5_09915 [Rhizobiaceae bacterium]
MSLVHIKDEMLRNAKMVVPPVLGMSVVLGLFNAQVWTFNEIFPRVALSFTMAVMGCLFGLFALFVGLKTTNQMQSVMAGWLAGLMIGFAGIAFMLWFYANPVN